MGPCGEYLSSVGSVSVCQSVKSAPSKVGSILTVCEVGTLWYGHWQADTLLWLPDTVADLLFNSLIIRMTLVLIMAWHLPGGKPLPELILTYCQLDPQEQTSVKFKSKYNNLHSKKIKLKMLSAKWCPFCLCLCVLRPPHGYGDMRMGGKYETTCWDNCHWELWGIMGKCPEMGC